MVLPLGLELFPTKNTYMDTKTWEKITPAIIEGYQSMNPHAKATRIGGFLKLKYNAYR